MIITDGLTEIEQGIYTKVALGKFDGIHIGHRKLLHEMISSDDGLKSVIFTFALNSPVSFNPENTYIYDEAKRREIFESLGADYLVEYYLDEPAAAMDPKTFVREILVKRLHTKCVFCGEDLSFGYKGKGNVETIKSLEDELGISVRVIEKEKYSGSDVSSTRIRNAIRNNDIADADAMLGRDRKD